MRRSSLRNPSRLISTLALAALAASSQAAAPSKTWCADRCDQIVIDWNQQTHQVIKAADGYRDPMAASRVLAMHDAANAAQPRYRAYAYQPDAGPSHTSADAAVATAVAAHDVLAALYPGQQALLRATLDATLLDAGVGPVEQGRQLGTAAAITSSCPVSTSSPRRTGARSRPSRCARRTSSASLSLRP